MSNTVKVRTNNRARELRTVQELPLNVQADFSYISVTDAEPRIVRYKGAYYDVLDCQPVYVAEGPPFSWRVQPEHPFARWDSALAETYFSGVLFRHVGDGFVVCGSYTS